MIVFFIGLIVLLLCVNALITEQLRVESTNSRLTWSQSRDVAAGKDGRLPTHAEVRAHLERHGNTPIFEVDMWWPVGNSENKWVSVGNYEPGIRLGREHGELFGPPSWGTTNDHHGFRSTLAVLV